MTLQQLALIPDDTVNVTASNRHCTELTWDKCSPTCTYPSGPSAPPATQSPTETTPTTPPTSPPSVSRPVGPPGPVATPVVTDVPDTGNAPPTGVPPGVIGGSGDVSKLIN